MATWPLGLPQSPLLEGFRDEPDDSVLRSSFPASTKQRPRFTAVFHNVNEVYWLTRAEYSIFLDFYKNELKNGALTFTKPDTLEGGTATFQIVDRYRTTWVADNVKVSLTMIKEP